MKKISFVTLIGLCLLALPVRATINLLHEFAGGGANGRHPYGALIISGTTLYGMTSEGGSADIGTIFKIQTNGTGFTLLHEFAGGAADGNRPTGSLILSGSTLYGMTQTGGDSNLGTIFKIETNGTGFTLLHEFAGAPGDGNMGAGSLILSDSILYGMTVGGGASNSGTIFKIQVDGSGFALLHSFAGGNADGAYPQVGALILSGTHLYGMTIEGGNTNYGTVFKIETNGTGFALLHEFAGGVSDGSRPAGSLIISGSTLYGVTLDGGGSDYGTVFKIGIDGSGFALLHNFDPYTDGSTPYSDLILSDSTLYGMIKYGGIFRIQTDGESFALLHEFVGGADDGEEPHGALLLSGSTLYGMTYGGGDNGDGVIFSQAPGITVTSPNGGESFMAGTSRDIIWSTTGKVDNVNIDYSTNSGGNWTSIASNTANDSLYSWAISATPSTTCLVRVQEADGEPTDQSDAMFSIVAFVDETVSAPTTPTGPASGLTRTSHEHSTGGSTSSLGHTVQYKFDWDDGSDSGWLAVGTTAASHIWLVAGTYNIRAMARCATDTPFESLWSASHTVIIYDDAVSGNYNSPAQYKVLPEVIWAFATGGGTWMSEVQVTDISGGSQVSVLYNTASGRRGPFMLWDNSAGGALRSQKYSNMLQTIDDLDGGVFTYYGTVGAVEFISQDSSHLVQVTARTLNGSYSKTFPAFSLHDSNTANYDRVMVVPNLTNNSIYRSTCGMFNPTIGPVTLELKLLDTANTQIGSTITKTISGYGFTAFSPFNDAGVAYPANSFDNVILEIQPTSGTGKVLCFGASANNATNDPAAHIAVQNSVGHDNGPSSLQILPEAIWAFATGGGTWMSETQIVDVSGGSIVSVYFDYGSGNRRGPFVLWTGGIAGSKVKYSNILQQIGTIDTGFTYYGRVGTVEFHTQDSTHHVQVTARTLNGNYSKTFPGLNLVDAETADMGRMMLIQNYASNSTYRSTCGFFNPTADAVTVEFTLLNASGIQIGVPFSKTFVGYDYQAFLPFNEAGVPYPANSFDNVILRVRPTSGSGQVVCFGASANNASNDPAAHLAVQGQ